MEGAHIDPFTQQHLLSLGCLDVCVFSLNIHFSFFPPLSFPQLHDIETLKKFLTSKKPHVVAVAGENR